MDLVSWAFTAIDRIFSTRKQNAADPLCPLGSYQAGYTIDTYGKWNAICFFPLEINYVEDVYLQIFMLIGLGAVSSWIWYCFNLIRRKVDPLVRDMARMKANQVELYKKIVDHNTLRCDEQLSSKTMLERSEIYHTDEQSSLKAILERLVANHADEQSRSQAILDIMKEIRNVRYD